MSSSRAMAGLADGTGCPICLEGWPLDVIAEFSATWITAGRDAQLPGYACVVSKRHVVEPYELAGPSAASFARRRRTLRGHSPSSQAL